MDAENDKIYAAEKIVRKRIQRGQVEYFVKWKGWSHRNNTWEPVKNILDRRLIEAYEAEDSKSTQKDAKKSPRVSLQSASNDDSLNDKLNDTDRGEVENSFSDYLTKKSNSKLSTPTANGGSNETRKGKRKSFADSDTTESSSSSSCSRTGKNDRSSSSSSSSHSSRSSSRVTSIASRRRRKLSEGGGGHGKENSDAKRKVQILSKVFPKETNKKDVSGSRVLKQCSSNGKSSLLSDEALHVIKKVSERDSCDIFGEYVATEVRKYSERTRSIVQHMIHNILFDADMGKYGEVSTLKCEKPNDTSAFSDGKFSPTRKNTAADSNSLKSPPKTSSSLVNETPVHLTNASSSQKPANTSDADDVQKILSSILHTNADTQPKSLSPSKKAVSPSTTETAK